MTLFERYFIAIAATVILAFVAITVANFSLGSIYDTEHFGDTIFMLGAAWRAAQGLVPVVDFGHFYGGFVSQSLGWTMRLFGPEATTFYAYSLLMTGGLITSAVICLGPRISTFGLWATIVTIVALILTRNPLELNTPVIQVVSAHSFLYNRFAQSAVLIAAIFATTYGSARKHEIIGGIIIGLLGAAVCLTKSTFAIVLLGLFIALLLHRRWHAIAATLTGLVIGMLVLDPGLARFFGALDYALAHVGDNNDVMGLIRKSILIPLFQPISTAAALGVVGYMCWCGGRWMGILAILAATATIVAMTATMGGNGSYGQLALPTTIGVLLGCLEIARRHDDHHLSTLQAITAAVVLGFAGPHMVNAAGSMIKAQGLKSAALITTGPYRGYVSLPDVPTAADGTTQYQMFADGIAALHKLGTPADWGIIANGGMSFEHALRAKPVVSYPLWQRPTAPELAPDKALDANVDIILVTRAPDAISTLLTAKITPRYTRCLITTYWTIYAHKRLELGTCSASSQ